MPALRRQWAGSCALFLLARITSCQYFEAFFCREFEELPRVSDTLLGNATACYDM